MIKKVFKKSLTLGLCALILASLFSCGEKTAADPATSSDNDSDSVSETTAESGQETDSKGYVLDNIPKVNYDGKKIRILVWEENKNYVMPETSETNDVVQSEVYFRNMAVEDRLGISFEPSFAKGSYANKNEFINKATKAGESDFDIICSYSLWPSVLAQQKVLLDLKELKYPELDMPWWPESISSWEQYGNQFFVTDNSSVSIFRELEVMFAHSGMIADMGLEDPAVIAKNGEWTLDKLGEYVDAFQTVDSTGTAASDKKYALVVDDFSRLDSFFYSSGLNCTRNDADGVARLSLESDKEKTVDLINKLYGILDRDNCMIAANSTEKMQKYQTVFMTCAMFQVTRLDDSSVYTVLPMPKYDDKQENYKTIDTNGYEVYCVPVTAADPEVSGLVIEALASQNYRKIAPFYYEQYLKGRYSTSDLGRDIFDIIRSSIVLDFGRVSAESLGVTETPFRNCFWSSGAENYNNTYSSQLAVFSKIYTKKLNEIHDIYMSYSTK